MLITDINQMEEIVGKNKNLSWDGWDVVFLAQDDYAEFLHHGHFDRITKKWYRKTIYSCGSNGWEIPDSVLQ